MGCADLDDAPLLLLLLLLLCTHLQDLDTAAMDALLAQLGASTALLLEQHAVYSMRWASTSASESSSSSGGGWGGGSGGSNTGWDLLAELLPLLRGARAVLQQNRQQLQLQQELLVAVLTQGASI
jgi:hypothetical protein